MTREDREYREMLRNLTEVQKRCTELIEENRAYRQQLTRLLKGDS